MKTSWQAFDDTVNATTQGASAGIAAYNKSIDDMIKGTDTGLDKIMAAYDKLHPDIKQDIKGKHGKMKGKKIGTRTITQTSPWEDAGKFLDAFESGIGANLAKSSTSAQKFAEGWANSASGKMHSLSWKILAPIVEYIKAHSKEPAQQFISGLAAFLGTPQASISEGFRKALLSGGEFGAKTSAPVVGKTLMQNLDLTSQKGILQTQLDNVMKTVAPPKKDVKVTATTQGKEKLDLMKKTLDNIKSKKIVLSVSAQIGANVQEAVNLASRFSGMGAHPGRKINLAQHGMHETVHQPTLILAGEAGDERVDIGPGGKGGGGGDIYVGPIYLDGTQIQGVMRRKIGDDQGIFK